MEEIIIDTNKPAAEIEVPANNKAKKKPFKHMFKECFELRWDNASPKDIRQSIVAGSKVKGTNMCILVLAIFIASIGLNVNSTPVIIGAMLISPLMGGIMAVGYGVAVDDLKLSRNAAVGLLAQLIICIITSTIYFLLTPITTAHSELLARTHPTVWDVLIAICGGLAGIIGITRKEKSNVIPGVAIATALMPPLCTAGYGIATGQLRFFAGAMYLFFINSFFICITTIIVLKAMRIPVRATVSKSEKRKIRTKIIIMAVVTIIPSIYLTAQSVENSLIENNAEKYFVQEFADNEELFLVNGDIDMEEKKLKVAIVGTVLSQSDIQRLNDKLPDYGLSGFKLIVVQNNAAT